MIDWIIPDWPSPKNVNAIFTTRKSSIDHNVNGIYTGLNLADYVNDDPVIVLQNRTYLRQYLPDNPRWLTQVHGSKPIWVDSDCEVLEGDAAMSRRSGVVCAVLVADCLPILLCDTAGSVVGVVHAGWRGLVRGIIENTVKEMRKFSQSDQMIAWLGPAIGPGHFEVGDEVRSMFIENDSQAVNAFTSGNKKGKWYANLFNLARQRLTNIGIYRIYGGDICTFSDPERFYSYRRDGITGRMACLLWIENDYQL